jgi:hypothetical protein
MKPLDAANQRSISPALVGRAFVHPAFDYAFIGGALSLVVTALVVLYPGAQSVGQMSPSGADGLALGLLPYAVLFVNGAHLAASTVRLYTKPGSFASLPVVTRTLPLAMLGLVFLCLFLPGSLGRHIQALYLTWSPYHYAAQAFGIAMVYSHRSGCRIDPAHKRLLRWVAMLPFLYVFTNGEAVGVEWLLPGLAEQTQVLRAWIGNALELLAFTAPFLLYALVWRSASGPMPLIGLLAVLSNGVWFLVLSPLDAFLYATVFHGLQYLAITIAFYVKERVALPGQTRSALGHALRFYALCLLLAYAILQCLPLGFTWVGFGVFESVLVVTAAVNVHHFIVDAFIWRFRSGDSNRNIVELRDPARA